LSELKLAVPWGHIAAKAWGLQQAAPVLCLHGWLDNANSFDRLIPLLPKDFHYVAMDFGGHGPLETPVSPGKSLSPFAFFLSYSFFPFWVTSQFTSIFPEMVDKLILLDTSPFGLDPNVRMGAFMRAVTGETQAEASQKPRQVVKPEEMLQGYLKRNSHVSEEIARLLLQRGTTEVATGLVMNRHRRMTVPEQSISFVSKELFTHSAKQLQAPVLLIKSIQGYYNVRREDTDKNVFVPSPLQRFQYVKVPGNHYVHLNQPEIVARIISAFLQSQEPPPHQP
uniref:Serine hydrolase like 2 n=1 Tax=Ailuropoda melanoleuca TaxID=9646 RepID=A0A7N5KE61_AILME